MGGRGSSSMSKKSGGAAAAAPSQMTYENAQKQIKELGAQLELLSGTMSRYASEKIGYDNNAPWGTKEGHDKYVNAFNEYHKLRSQRDALVMKSVELARKQTTRAKTFVNSFGEATTREITSTSYKAQQRRLDKELLAFLGR